MLQATRSIESTEKLMFFPPCIKNVIIQFRNIFGLSSKSSTFLLQSNDMQIESVGSSKQPIGVTAHLLCDGLAIYLAYTLTLALIQLGCETAFLQPLQISSMDNRWMDLLVCEQLAIIACNMQNEISYCHQRYSQVISSKLSLCAQVQVKS